MADHTDVTALLHSIEAGDRAATDELFPLVYAELRALAGSFFRGQRPDHTLQPTALVHDAYLKLVRQPDLHVTGRAHFMAVASRAMRHILINHARERRAAKRGGGASRVTLLDAALAEKVERHEVDPIELDDAMRRLEELDERQCRIVELRFFGGLSVDDAATVLGVSAPTVKRDWKMARAWLFDELVGDSPP